MIFWIPVFLVLGHLYLWIVTKLVMWVASQLFHAPWDDKFWPVYVAVILLSVIFGSAIKPK